MSELSYTAEEQELLQKAEQIKITAKQRQLELESLKLQEKKELFDQKLPIFLSEKEQMKNMLVQKTKQVKDIQYECRRLESEKTIDLITEIHELNEKMKNLNHEFSNTCIHCTNIPIKPFIESHGRTYTTRQSSSCIYCDKEIYCN